MLHVHWRPHEPAVSFVIGGNAIPSDWNHCVSVPSILFMEYLCQTKSVQTKRRSSLHHYNTQKKRCQRTNTVVVPLCSFASVNDLSAEMHQLRVNSATQCRPRGEHSFKWPFSLFSFCRSSWRWRRSAVAAGAAEQRPSPASLNTRSLRFLRDTATPDRRPHFLWTPVCARGDVWLSRPTENSFLITEICQFKRTAAAKCWINEYVEITFALGN